MINWLEGFVVCLIFIVVIAVGPVILILSLANGLWGYTVVGALFSILGAFVAKSVFGKSVTRK
jgi:hypothetical protein